MSLAAWQEWRMEEPMRSADDLVTFRCAGPVIETPTFSKIYHKI